jgi:HSP20 family molecular chaperone IbpA
MSTTGQNIQSAGHVPAKVEQRPAPRRVYAPRVDVYESTDAYVVTADVPGVAEDGLEITVEKNRLTIDAHVAPVERNGYRLRVAEHPSGDFHRTFALPDTVDRERIEARLKNGVLQVTLPKSEALRPRRITIQPSA